MTFSDLLQLFKSWGHEVKPEHAHGFEIYWRTMLARRRVLFIIDAADEPQAVVTFFLTNSYQYIYKKSMWATPVDEPTGRQIYIDKMVAREWTLPLRRSVQEMIEAAYPNVMEGYYHRAPKDRCVRIFRRRKIPCAITA